MSTTYTEGGPGRKKCDCGIFVAARTGTCPKCGHIFVSRAAVEPAVKRTEGRSSTPSPSHESEEEEKPKTMNVLLSPAGKCPVQLEGFDLGSVQEWAHLLKAVMPGVIVSRSCALQFLRQFFPWGSPEFNEARSHLKHCRALHPDSEFRE